MTGHLSRPEAVRDCPHPGPGMYLRCRPIRGRRQLSPSTVNYARFCIARALEELSPLLDSETAGALAPGSTAWHAVANAWDQINDVRQASDTPPEGGPAC